MTPFGSSSAEIEGLSDAADRLVRHMARKVSRNGSDIRVCVGQPTNPKLYPRQSVPANFWEWQITLKRRWQCKEHINALELRGILLSIQWRLEHVPSCNMRVLHLSDSAVSISILSTGRTSSKALAYIARKINSLQLLHNMYVLSVHVDSMQNPTDAASR